MYFYYKNVYTRLGVDILAVQETNMKDINITKMQKYIFFNGGGQQNRLGTGFLVINNLRMMIVDYKVINNRLSYLRLKGKYRIYTLMYVCSCSHRERGRRRKNKIL